jgi:hypothetical protein
MTEQSHRDAMNAAIRAQRERQAARSSAAPLQPLAAEPPEQPPERQPEPEPRRSVLGRLLGR